MKKMLSLALVAFASTCACTAADPAPAAAPAAEQKAQVMFGQVDGQVFAAGDNRVMILNPDGSIAWQHRTSLTTDGWVLANGNILFGDGSSVTEVTRDHQVVFQYKSPANRGDATYGCQRLANGNTLVGENATGKVLEVDPQGKVVFELQTINTKPNDHQNQRVVRKLENGNYLVCHSGEHVVREYQPDAKIVWEQKTPNLAFAAIRKADGNTLVSCLDKLVEYKPDHTIAWEFKNTDIPDVKITNMTTIQILGNGNILVGCYAAYNKDGGTGLFEITADKKLVWRFADRKTAGTMMAAQKLDAAGKTLPGKTLR
jgi:hypothetical protein